MNTETNHPTSSTSTTPSPAFPRKKRSWVWSILLACVVFSAGGITGGAGTLLFIHRQLGEFIRHPREAPDRIIPLLKRRLRLDDAQTEQVSQIIREHHRNLQQIRLETSPRVRQEIHQIETKVAAVLTPQQRQLWNTRLKQLTDFWFPNLSPDQLPEAPEKSAP